MEKKNKILIGLIVIILAIFLLYPNLQGKGSELPKFSLMPDEIQTMEVPSDVPCETVQDCLEFAASKGDTEGIKAKCQETCIYIVEIKGEIQ